MFDFHLDCAASFVWINIEEKGRAERKKKQHVKQMKFYRRQSRIFIHNQTLNKDKTVDRPTKLINQISYEHERNPNRTETRKKNMYDIFNKTTNHLNHIRIRRHTLSIHIFL